MADGGGGASLCLAVGSRGGGGSAPLCLRCVAALALTWSAWASSRVGFTRSLTLLGSCHLNVLRALEVAACGSGRLRLDPARLRRWLDVEGFERPSGGSALRIRGGVAALPSGSGDLRRLWAAHRGAAGVGARSDWDWSVLACLRLSAMRKEVVLRNVGVLAALGCVDQWRYCVGVVVVLLRVKAWPVLAGRRRRRLWASLFSLEASSRRPAHPHLPDQDLQAKAKILLQGRAAAASSTSFSLFRAPS